MALAQHLTDVIGPRLTNSPGARKAEDWALATFSGWGLDNVHREGFTFGRGWTLERSSVRMLTPRPLQLSAQPISWTPSTNGPISGGIVLAPITSVDDFARWRGKLAGRIVLISDPSAARAPLAFNRFSDAELADMTKRTPPGPPTNGAKIYAKYETFPHLLERFLKDEGAIAYATMTRLDGKTVMGDGYRIAVGDTPTLPGVEIAAEDYRRLVRLAALNLIPTLEIDARVAYDDSDDQAYNVFGDIAGRDAKAGYVMAGAHMDSAAPADGATDNAAGVAMVMEAARILKTLPRPRRTIRFALWSGEEQGMLGSMAYVERHLAKRGRPGDPPLTGAARFLLWLDRWPIVPCRGWRDLSVYFNLDNGTGSIRGIYAERNDAAVPIFRDWLAPFAKMGASTVAIDATGGSDNALIDAVGVPAFQFIQDWGDYGRTHHTWVDTFDHLDADSMKQSATILASFLWNAANADQPFPRRAISIDPKAPKKDRRALTKAKNVLCDGRQ